jgi:integration host factor subunit beta
MTKRDLWRALAQDNPAWTAQEVATAVDVFFEEISRRLVDGGRVEIRGFGVFSTRSRVARVGRNPKTGEKVDVPATRSPHFKYSREMISRLNAE